MLLLLGSKGKFQLKGIPVPSWPAGCPPGVSGQCHAPGSVDLAPETCVIPISLLSRGPKQSASSQA